MKNKMSLEEIEAKIDVLYDCKQKRNLCVVEKCLSCGKKRNLYRREPIKWIVVKKRNRDVTCYVCAECLLAEITDEWLRFGLRCGKTPETAKGFVVGDVSEE